MAAAFTMIDRVKSYGLRYAAAFDAADYLDEEESIAEYLTAQVPLLERLSPAKVARSAGSGW